MALTRNVMQLNNISAGKGKKITFEDIIFDRNFFEGNMPSVSIDNPYMTTDFQKYWKTYLQKIDIANRYSSGAKYLYTFAPSYYNNMNDTIMGGNINHVCFKSSQNALVQDVVLNVKYLNDLESLKEYGKSILTIDKRLENAVEPTETRSFDLVLCESIYDIKTFLDKGASYIQLGTTIAGTYMINSNSYQVAIPPDICKLEAYFIYEK